MAPKALSVYSVDELVTMDRADLLTFKSNIEEALSVSEENAMNSLKEQLSKAGIDPRQFALFIGAGVAPAAPAPRSTGGKGKDDPNAALKAQMKEKYNGKTILATAENGGKADYVVGKRGPVPDWVITAMKEGTVEKYLGDDEEVPGVVTPD